MLITNIAIPSADHAAVINIVTYSPKETENIKGLIQVCHGMTEYMERYEDFSKYFTERGYVVFGNDIISHGRSTTSKTENLYFTDWSYVVEDMSRTRKYVSRKFPETDIFLLGFSLGSFIVRTADNLSAYKKEILIGTGYQSAFLLHILRKLITRKFSGKMEFSSEWIKNIAFDNYNKKFPGKPDNYWLLTDDGCRKEYEEDLFVKKNMTPAFFCEFLKGMELASKKLTEPNNTIPTIFLYGKDDPVSGFGKGVRVVYEKYKAANKLTKIQSFPGTHDILHDKWNKEVFASVYTFLEED